MRDIKSIDFDVGGKFSRKNIKLIYIYKIWHLTLGKIYRAVNFLRNNYHCTYQILQWSSNFFH